MDPVIRALTRRREKKKMRKKEKAMGLVKRCNEFTGEEMRDVQLLGLPLSKHELITISCVFISFVQVRDWD